MEKKYKEPNISEMETTINVLYEEKYISVYTNKPDLQKKLLKILGEPEKEYKRGKSILSSMWNIPLSDKTKITRMMLKANIFEI